MSAAADAANWLKCLKGRVTNYADAHSLTAWKFDVYEKMM